MRRFLNAVIVVKQKFSDILPMIYKIMEEKYISCNDVQGISADGILLAFCKEEQRTKSRVL